MDFSKILSIVGAEYETSLRLVKYVKQFLSNAEYEAISQREEQSLPSVYLQYDGKRPLVFDLRKSESAQVFFWIKENLPRAVRDRFNMVPHLHTGWVGMTIIRREDAKFREQLQVIVDYWNECLKSIARGEHQSPHRRQATIMALALRAFSDYSVINDRKSIPGFNGRPDIYVPELKIVIEIDGKQHYEFVKYFHRNQGDFQNQQIRDKKLNEACKINRITVMRIVEDAVDLIASASELRDLVTQAKAKTGVTYLMRHEDELRFLDESRFENIRKKRK